MTQASAYPWREEGATPFISIKNITKRFGNFTAVDDISLDIYKGELFGLLGGSGCGKTTLLRMLAGFETPTSGSISIDGTDMTDVPPYERPVNMMFQSYALFPHMNVQKNVAYGLKRDGVASSEIKDRVAEILAMVELSDFSKRKPSQLSGGQRQRVALARAIIRRPSVFLMDEPLSNLDAKLRGHMRAELKHMQQSMGITTIYVTHDQIEAMTLAHRVAILEKGVLQQLATPAQIYNDPENLFVAQFIGSPPMNVVHGSFEGNEFITEGVRIRTTVQGRVENAVMGIRPEDCAVAAPAEGTLSGKIYTNELIGDHTLVTVDWGGDQISVKASKDFDGQQGDEIGLVIPSDRLFIFDESTGMRVR